MARILTVGCWLAGVLLPSAEGSADNETCVARCAEEVSIATGISDERYLSTFLLGIEGIYEGVTVRLQIADFQETFMKQSLIDFCSVTGCTPDFQVTNNANWHDDVEQDLKYAKMCDGYIFFGAWMPEFASQGLIEPLTDRVRNQPSIGWLDIYPSVRENSATFKNDIYMVPLDGDVIQAIYRIDLLEAYGIPHPQTFTELADAAELLHNKDHNGDGELDFGICVSTKRADIAGQLFWAAIAPFLQTQGTEEGVFFDPGTMAPKMHDSIFGVAMEIYKRLVLASPFASLGETDWQTLNSYFDEGRCAFTINFPGPVKMIIANQGAATAYNLTGKLSVVKLPGVACEDFGLNCLHAQNGVNYAPFYAGGGAAGQIRASTDGIKKDAMFDYFKWMSDPEIGYLIVSNPGTLLDPFRFSHVEALALSGSNEKKQAFLDQGWEERQLQPLKELVEDVFSSPNAALDIRIPGGAEYTESETVKYLVEYWKGASSLADTTARMVAGWNAVTNKYGLESQRDYYRASLGLAPYEPPEDQSAENVAAIVLLTVGVVVGSLLVLGAVAHAARRVARALRAEREQREQGERHAKDEFAKLMQLGCNMVLISFRDFVEGGALIQYEEARERGLHINFDTYDRARLFCKENAVVFLSHQWLGTQRPDPQNVHFNQACAMCEQLIERNGLEHDSTYIWVDYTCIPQDNKTMQRLAIGSIQVYATLPRFFVCLTPEAGHEMGHVCSSKTYFQRGWCRLEQWARVSVGGLSGMYSYDGQSLREFATDPVSLASNESWLDLAIRVCLGDFTDPEDRHRLKGVICSLWMYAVLTKDRDDTVYTAVERQKKDVFPPEYFGKGFIDIAESVCSSLKTTQWEELFRHSIDPTGSNSVRTARSVRSTLTAAHDYQFSDETYVASI